MVRLSAAISMQRRTNRRFGSCLRFIELRKTSQLPLRLSASRAALRRIRSGRALIDASITSGFPNLYSSAHRGCALTKRLKTIRSFGRQTTWASGRTWRSAEHSSTRSRAQVRRGATRGVIMPAMLARRVDFPEPLGPSSASTSLFWTGSETFRKAALSP
jgi:hypothetical protein